MPWSMMYCVFLENLYFPSFSRLMEAVRRTNESVSRTSKPNFISRFDLVARPPSPLRKRPITTAVERLGVRALQLQEACLQARAYGGI